MGPWSENRVVVPAALPTVGRRVPTKTTTRGPLRHAVGTPTPLLVCYSFRRVEYDYLIKSQLAPVQLTLGPCVVRIWSSNTPYYGVKETLAVQNPLPPPLGSPQDSRHAPTVGS